VQLSDDFFTLFGLPRNFDLDRAVLDERFRALQGKVHPDKFVQASAAEQRLAMQWSLRVNEGYALLKDSLARARYLCELAGAPVKAERHAAMPAGFLETQIELREALADADSAEEMDALAAQTKRLIAQYQDAMKSALHVEDYASAAQHIRALMFVRKFSQDIEEKQERLSV
jgi:molecular chaperone HscB